MYLVRLLEIRRHLRQKLIARDPYIDRISISSADFILNLHRTVDRRTVTLHEFSDVHITFVHTYLLNAGRIFFLTSCRTHPGIFPQEIHKPVAVLPVQLVIRRLHHKSRALAEGIHDRLPCTDAVLLRRDRLRKHDTVPWLLISSDNGRNLS